MSGTKRFMEQRMQKSRMQEGRESDLKRMLVENNILAGHGKSELNVENRRRARSAACIRGELFMDYVHCKGAQDKERGKRISQFEENLADEMARRKAEALREEMDKRRICDGSEELRALKERLHAAKVNKERAMQLLQVEVGKANDRHHSMAMDEVMENERLEHLELEHKLNIEKTRQRERVKLINQQQIAANEAKKQDALNEYLREREQVEELVCKIAQEDETEQRARDEKKVEARQMLRQFMHDQKAKQKLMEQTEREELERIEQFACDKRAREERLQSEKDEVAATKAAIFKSQLSKAERVGKDKEELEHLRGELMWEELEAQRKRAEESKMRKKLEDREEMKNAYLSQMEAKERRAANFIAEEEKAREALLRKFAEDDRIVHMNDQKKRLKVEQHKREATRLIEMRREMFDAARSQERAESNILRGEESKRQVVIEAERQRLLKEHAVGLRDHLPKYTLEKREDYEFLFADRLKRSQSSSGYPTGLQLPPLAHSAALGGA